MRSTLSIDPVMRFGVLRFGVLGSGALAFGLGACALPAPPPSAPPPEIAAGASTARPTTALLAPFAGRYASGGEVLTISTAGDRLMVERPGRAATALSLVGSGTFADAQGNAYLFTPATGGAATRLTLIGANGTRRDWNR